MVAQHVNTKPLKISATTSHAEGTFDDSYKFTGFTIFNPDTTNIMFVCTGATPVADNTCQYVPPNTTKTFIKGTTDAKVSVLMSGGSGVTAYITPSNGTDGLN